MTKTKKQLEKENAILFKVLEIKQHTAELIDKSTPTFTKVQFLIGWCFVGAIALLMWAIVSYLDKGISMNDFLLLIGCESFFLISGLILNNVMKTKD